MMAALRGQAATWGGSANLVVPWTDDLLERPELWNIAAALDPDVIAIARISRSDFAGIVAEDDPVLHANEEPPARDRGALERVLRAFAERLPILQRNGHARPLFADAAGTRFPCTPVVSVGAELGPAPALRCPADLDLGLMLAAESGDMADSAISTLAQRRAVVTPYDLSQEDARERVLRGPRQPGAGGTWAVTEVGLRWLSPVTRNPRAISVVVGDDPWDFALGYALRRLTSLAWWLPSSVLTNPYTVPWLLHRIDEIGDLAERSVVTSVSDSSAAENVATELTTSTSDNRTWEIRADASDLLRDRPARLFARVPGLETFALENGVTGFIPPELPDVGEAFGQRIYWMAELIGENWQPLPDARLAADIVRWPSYDSTSARPTRSGAAYLCPHFVRMSDDMASEVVRPRIAALGLSEQLSTILAEGGWRLEPSDKGQYAEGVAKLFGGDDELRAALGLTPADVSVKATTNERIGFIGRGEGIAALAVATIDRTR
jgi:hypothetical protein